MAYLGNTPTTQSFIEGTDYFSGTGSQTAFTLSRSVVSVNDIQATVNNVVQNPSTAYTVSGTTITFTSAPSSGSNNIYVRYLSTTTQSITPSQNTVSYSTLNSDTQSKLGISFKNRIINGAMVIDQRNAGASITPANNDFGVDRFKYQLTQSGKITSQQNAGSVTPPVGFTNYLGITSTSAYSVVAADQFCVSQYIEGYNVADLGFGTANAKTITVSAWVYSSLTGTFSGVIQNSAANRCYPFTYTISSANTWTQVNATIPGDTTGTWLTTNGAGLRLIFSFGNGSTYAASAGAWTSQQYTTAATGTTSVVGTSGATFYITGVQLEVGTQATTFDYRSYGIELALCQRYYTKIIGSMGANGTSATIAQGSYYTSTTAYYLWTFPTTMRTAPTLSSTSSGFTMQTLNSGGDGANATIGSGNAFSPYTVSFSATCASSGAVSNNGSWITTNSASSFVAVSAEL
jgi:hypothetical protein